VALSIRVKFALFATAVMLAVSAIVGCARLNRMATRPTIPSSPFQNSPLEDERDHSIVVSIPVEGRFYLGREPVNSLEELRGLLLQRLDRKPAGENVVYIKTAERVKSGVAANVAEVVRSVGAAPRFVRKRHL